MNTFKPRRRLHVTTKRCVVPTRVQPRKGHVYVIDDSIVAMLRDRFAQDLAGVPLDVSLVDINRGYLLRPTDCLVTDIPRDPEQGAYVIRVDHRSSS